MPFTPLHMGPAAVIKAVADRHFSLMVFGWSQIVIDIQPLVVMVVSEGHVHGFTHTYMGATLIGLFCAFTGKPLGEIGLRILKKQEYLPIAWATAFISAFIGTYSHVFFDSIMHYDVQPFWPFTLTNNFQGITSIAALNLVCVATGVVGSIAFYIIGKYQNRRKLSKMKNRF